MRRTIAALLALTIALPSTALAADKKAKEKKVESTGTNPLVYVGFGVAGVGVLVGSLYGADSLHATNTARERCVDGRCPASSFDFIDQAKTSAAISNVAFGVAIVGLGIGVYGLLAKPSAAKEEGSPDYHPAPPGISLNVNVGPGSIALTGAF
jgi:hypothetical protein